MQAFYGDQKLNISDIHDEREYLEKFLELQGNRPAMVADAYVPNTLPAHFG